MGGNLGCHRSIPRDPMDSCEKKRKFSATCNFSNVLVNQERVNINSATEEELMTLPGVNRTVARSIVEYRARIGGFRKVEDVALVSGVGAAKLELIKPEICVSREHEQPVCAGVNVNSATVAQLLSVRGVTEKVARCIVEHRHSHGPFRGVEDLVRVDGVSASLLDRIRPQVFVARSRTPSTHTNGGLTAASPTSASLHSEDPDLPPGGPAHLSSARPRVEPFCGTRGGKAVVRVATWSLQSCSGDKANNPGVKEVVCMTLLENDIKLLAVQDLLDREALEKFCAELNQGTLGSVRRWPGPRGTWSCTISEEPTSQFPKGPVFSGFLWNSTCGIDLKEAVLLESLVSNGNGRHSHRRPFLGRFTIGSSELTVVNIHLGPPPSGDQNGKSRADGHKATRLADGMQGTLRGEKDLLVLGDFGLPPDSGELDLLRKEKLTALVPPTQFTNISTRTPQGSRCLDNIWVSRALKKVYTGHCWVVREGLTNPWIPDNWSWGGVASDHCPLVAEFYTDAVAKEVTENGNRSGVPVLDREDATSKQER
ncbi:endonuclease/exonuclease/phosphatase family domain-containing protein 1-like [Arapaima gigas]